MVQQPLETICIPKRPQGVWSTKGRQVLIECGIVNIRISDLGNIHYRAFKPEIILCHTSCYAINHEAGRLQRPKRSYLTAKNRQREFGRAKYADPFHAFERQRLAAELFP